ncbi:MAG: hypothetical protein ACI3V5_01555 [Faecousia sp.]
MAKKRMQMAQKSWKIEEIFPRFVNAQMAKDSQRHPAHEVYRVSRTLPFYSLAGSFAQNIKKQFLEVTYIKHGGPFCERLAGFLFCPGKPWGK